MPERAYQPGGHARLRPCQHVEMQVLNTLAAVLPHIGDNAVALFIYAQLTALVGNHSVDVPQQCGIFFGQCCGRSNVLLWNDQKVYRRLGINVVKGQQRVVLIQFVGGDFPRRDFTEQTIFHYNPSLMVV